MLLRPRGASRSLAGFARPASGSAARTGVAALGLTLGLAACSGGSDVNAVPLQTVGAPTAATGMATSDATAATPAPTATTPAPPAPTATAGPSRSAGPASPRPAAPRAGNPDGHATVPAQGRAVDTSHSSRVIGNGTPAGCTSAAVVNAIARGGIITFSCGPDPITITLTQTAKIRNASSTHVVIDGGGKVTLSGGGRRRILYLNTCDQELGWLTSHCQDQDRPRLTLQNITFADGNATGLTTDGGGGGGVFVRGGRLTIVNSRFIRNRCDSTGPDVGGAAVRVLDQYQDQPVYVVSSTFGGGPGLGGRCANGGALSSIGVSWVILNSLFTDNSAIGNGANPAQAGTPGGGSGGAIYTDGNRFTVRVAGSVIERNHANEGGGAIFFVSNDRTGSLVLESSRLRRNPSDGFQTAGYPGIFFLGSGRPKVSGSSLA